MKKIVACFVGGFLACSLVLAQPARAFVGYATGNAALTVLGFVVAAGPSAYKAVKGGEASTVSFLSMAVGVILMDGEGSQKVKFVPVNAGEAAKLGLSASEFSAYNSETEELNQVFEAVSAELDRLESPTVEASAQIWKSYANVISADALSGAQKIASTLVTE